MGSRAKPTVCSLGHHRRAAEELQQRVEVKLAQRGEVGGGLLARVAQLRVTRLREARQVGVGVLVQLVLSLTPSKKGRQLCVLHA